MTTRVLTVSFLILSLALTSNAPAAEPIAPIPATDVAGCWISCNSDHNGAFGTSHCSAVVTPSEFVADQNSPRDRGRFVMSRISN